MSLDLLTKVHLFPVRHHSPRTSAVLRAFLDEVKPKAILIEGPSDADHLADVLLDGETKPPVAILGYRTDGTPGSSLWPFASYSPEYVALAWAREHGAVAKFIDITIGQALAAHREPVDLGDPGALEEAEEDEDPEAAFDEEDPDSPPAEEADGGSGIPVDAPPPEKSLYQLVAESRGFRSFEEFWEASFEAPKYDPDAFRSALLAYADLVRAEPVDRSFHRARDAYMANRIAEAAAKGFKPEEIAVVVGAAHAAAFVAKDVEPALAGTLSATVSTAATVIPYSFPRLAEQTGYGAGNRAPQYYQRAHDAGCDFRRATLEVLVEFCDHLRLRGFMASLADTIEAYRLACTLAEIRGKGEPGLDEVREATIATMCRGDASHVDSFLWPTVIGRNVGKVASRIGKNSLQEEFWNEVESRRLPKTDSPEQFDLHLNNETEIGSSIFLHRLRIAGIPYGSFQGTHNPATMGRKQAQSEEPGGVEALKRPRERWEAQWTPSTDVALVEKIVLGDTLEQVCGRVLDERLTSAKSTGEVAEVLLESVVTSCSQTLSEALRACDGFASADTDLVSLAKAAHALSSLAGSGKSFRVELTQGGHAIPELARKTFERAVLRVVDGCTGTDEAVEAAKGSLRMLHQIALEQPIVDKNSWFSVANDLVTSYAVNPGCSGMACGLLYLAGQIDDAGVATIVSQRLSNVLEPEKAAAFLEGFFAVNALVLVKSRPVVQALDTFLCGIEAERFRDALPMLRRAFGPLGATERRYLLENLLGSRHIGDKAKEAAQIISESDKEKVKEAVKDLGDLDDLL